MTMTGAVRRKLGWYRELGHRHLTTLGFQERQSKITDDAREYWADSSSNHRWKSDSHWRDAEVFADNDRWEAVGRTHLELFDRLSRVVGEKEQLGRVVEWGCGGGANAVTFGPRASSFVGVEISQESLDECARQIAAVTATPFRPVVVDVGEPEAALAALGEPCDLFVCTYVFELVPSQEYGVRLLRIAHRALAPGGLAFVQIKYDTGSYRTRPRRRSYRTGLADMTTYRIDQFWSLSEECGFRPEAVHLVPKNDLDERYAYFLLSRRP
jgi:SAM-dependent methyltransferase